MFHLSKAILYSSLSLGLKENVIIGRLIPAGTGAMKNRDIVVSKENENLSFTEYAQFINTNNSELISEYLHSTPTSWLEESHNLALQIYKSTDENISYDYIFTNTPIVKTRLQQAGIRLAGLLNTLFDPTTKKLFDVENNKKNSLRTN